MATTPWRMERKMAGVTLREVARRSGINPGRLSIIERGVEPTEDEARRIVAAIRKAEAEAER